MSVSTVGVSSFLPTTKFTNVPNLLTAARFCPFTITQSPISGSGANVAGTVYYTPFVMDKTATFESMAVETTTSTATATTYLGVYSDNNGRPDQLIYVSSLIDSSGTGAITSTQTMTFVGGVRYWCAVLNLTASATYKQVPVGSTILNMGSVNLSTTHYAGYTVASQTSLTQTAPTVTTQQGSTVPRIGFWFYY